MTTQTTSLVDELRKASADIEKVIVEIRDLDNERLDEIQYRLERRGDCIKSALHKVKAT